MARRRSPGEAPLFALHLCTRRAKDGGVPDHVRRLEQRLNNPWVVLVAGVIALVLNVLFYFGVFVPRVAPLIGQAYAIGASVPEIVSGPGPEARGHPKASGGSGSEDSGGSAPEASAHPGAGGRSGPEAVSGKPGPEGPTGSVSDTLPNPPSDSPPEPSASSQPSPSPQSPHGSSAETPPAPSPEQQYR